MNSCSILYEIFYHVIVEMEESEYVVNQESCKGKHGNSIHFQY